MKDTYGKHYASMYTGSMVGAGPTVFALMGYVIATKDENGLLELNPQLLSFVFGTTIEDVQAAIDYLTAPDPKSRTKDEEGRRLIRVGQFAYQVVNHDLYTHQRCRDRTAYWKDYRRQRKSAHVRNGCATLRATNRTHVDVDVDEDSNAKKEIEIEWDGLWAGLRLILEGLFPANNGIRAASADFANRCLINAPDAIAAALMQRLYGYALQAKTMNTPKDKDRGAKWLMGVFKKEFGYRPKAGRAGRNEANRAGHVGPRTESRGP